MGRAPCCPKVGLNKGPWTPREDTLLINYIKAHGEGHWRSIPEKAGLLRCGKSCRLRWVNYLRPDIKRGNITPEEEDLIIRLHTLLGNRWSLIAGRLPGRTDNEIKNYWNNKISKRILNNQNVCSSSSPSSSQRNWENNINNNNSINSRESKRRLSYKKQYKKNALASWEITRPKVHLPKAIRVRSCFLSLTRNEDNLEHKVGGSGASRQPLGVLGNAEDVLPNCESFNEFELQENRVEMEIKHRPVYDEAEYGLLNGNYLSSCPLSGLGIPRTTDIEANNDNNNNMLDQLYMEYLELLKTTDHHHQMELDDPLLV